MRIIPKGLTENVNDSRFVCSLCADDVHDRTWMLMKSITTQTSSIRFGISLIPDKKPRRRVVDDVVNVRTTLRSKPTSHFCRFFPSSNRGHVASPVASARRLPRSAQKADTGDHHTDYQTRRAGPQQCSEGRYECDAEEASRHEYGCQRRADAGEPTDGTR